MAEVAAIAGIDVDAVSEWMLGHVADPVPPFRFEQIAGGLSNLTFLVSDAARGTWVLRRPPLGSVLPTAHDMAREHRVLKALGSSEVPVPRVLGLCEDLEVNGAPFFVMEKVDGVVYRDAAAVADLTTAERRRAAFAAVDVLVDIHGVDVDAVGLDGLGKRSGYVHRQLHRWSSQIQAVESANVALLLGVHARLVDAVPAEVESGLIHGDFRLDNCIVDPDDQTVRAVLDWELCTLGDPLADLGLTLAYWAEPDDEIQALPGNPTAAGGFPSRSELLERYLERSGLTLDDPSFHVAFGYWRIACITEGIRARYAASVMGDPTEDGERFGVQAALLGAAAARILDGQPI